MNIVTEKLNELTEKELLILLIKNQANIQRRINSVEAAVNVIYDKTKDNTSPAFLDLYYKHKGNDLGDCLEEVFEAIENVDSSLTFGTPPSEAASRIVDIIERGD